MRGHLYYPVNIENTASFSWKDIIYICKYLVSIQNPHTKVLPLPKLRRIKIISDFAFMVLNIWFYIVRCWCMVQDKIGLWPSIAKHLFYIFSFLCVWTCLLSLTTHKAGSRHRIYLLIIDLVRMLCSSVVGHVWIGEAMHK